MIMKMARVPMKNMTVRNNVNIKNIIRVDCSLLEMIKTKKS